MNDPEATRRPSRFLKRVLYLAACLGCLAPAVQAKDGPGETPIPTRRSGSWSTHYLVLTEPGDVMRVGGVLNFDKGFSLIGHGTIDAWRVVVEGRIFPGYRRPTPTFVNFENNNAIGSFTMGQDFTLGDEGVLEIDVRSPGNHDVLIVGGTANLSGMLRIQSLGYRPREGDRIKCIDARRIVGDFSEVRLAFPCPYEVEFRKVGGKGFLVFGARSPTRNSPRFPRRLVRRF